ncbi:hypothetical protein Y1Q_0008695 [Alligator mississippiensis]|uniref:Uncharacterized protein n=1 Tax=Alligator mississippiensis TaxID=8496 RepID=A0A151N9S7_ALLMI|nr:hypothetical protein Y1Q_0008695 [Alligator mississippiensis]
MVAKKQEETTLAWQEENLAWEARWQEENLDFHNRWQREDITQEEVQDQADQEHRAKLLTLEWEQIQVLQEQNVIQGQAVQAMNDDHQTPSSLGLGGFVHSCCCLVPVPCPADPLVTAYCSAGGPLLALERNPPCPSAERSPWPGPCPRSAIARLGPGLLLTLAPHGHGAGAAWNDTITGR